MEEKPASKDRRIGWYFSAPRHKFGEGLRGLKEELESLKNELVKDPLTGIYNRRGLEEISKKYTEIWKRDNGKSQLMVFVIDLDYFKEVNDRLGHEFGDRFLKTVSESWQNSFRREDVIAVVSEDNYENERNESSIISRTGGDEFVILAFTQNPEVIKERLREGFLLALRSLELPNDLKDRLGLSIGYARVGEGFEDANVLDLDGSVLFSKAKEIADKRMYEEKREKKNEER